MEKLPKPKNRVPLNITFPFSKSTGEEVLILDNLLIGYDKPLLGELNYKLYKNKKIAILGHNGVGKSTLLKTILGQQKSLGGSYKWNLSADINYFRQEENEFDDVNPINYLRYFYHLKTDGELRSILAKVGIGADLCLKPIKELSGGERQRIPSPHTHDRIQRPLEGKRRALGAILYGCPSHPFCQSGQIGG